jgi:hypothetical protein
LNSSLALSVLEEMSRIVVPVDKSLYENNEELAREQIAHREPYDWPVVAVALRLMLNGLSSLREISQFFLTAL